MMHIEPPDKQFFEAASGYVDLGMYLDANEELEKIDPFPSCCAGNSRSKNRDLSWSRKMGIDAANCQTPQGVSARKRAVDNLARIRNQTNIFH